jgi:hypothetical protein
MRSDGDGNEHQTYRYDEKGTQDLHLGHTFSSGLGRGWYITSHDALKQHASKDASDPATNKGWHVDWACLVQVWTASGQEVDLRGDSWSFSREKKGSEASGEETSCRRTTLPEDDRDAR